MEYDSDGLFLVGIGGKYGWVGKNGEAAINPQFEAAFSFYGNKLAAVKTGGKWAYADRKGQIAINPQFGLALPFFGDCAMVVNGGKIGFIDKKGNFAVQPLHEAGSNDAAEYFYAAYQKSAGLPAGDYKQFMEYGKLKEKKAAYAEAEKAAAEAKMKALAEKKASENAPPIEQEGSVAYEGHAYKTASMPDGKVWFAENMNYAAGNSVCYGNDEPKCDECGRLYDLATAKLICPKGWHLPSDAEWTALGNAVGGSSTAERVLKSKSGWGENGSGEDNYGFSALACGYLNTDGNFHNYGSSAHFWSATIKGDAAWDRNLYANRAGMVRNMHDKEILFSVRCVKD